uniref:Uncharacterized protein n=1 Tax=Timema cristinae TaxID=61476 RepID=A0A7R9DBN8_TIMCR|nr:unnamed protein product [Timema cristinae]
MLFSCFLTYIWVLIFYKNITKYNLIINLCLFRMDPKTFMLAGLTWLAFLNVLLYIIKKRRSPSRRWWVHPVNCSRQEEGEFVLFQKIKTTANDFFFEYCRMEVWQFKKLLQLSSPLLKKTSKRTLSPEMRLAITLRAVAFSYRLHELEMENETLRDNLTAIRKTVAQEEPSGKELLTQCPILEKSNRPRPRGENSVFAKVYESTESSSSAVSRNELTFQTLMEASPTSPCWPLLHADYTYYIFSRSLGMSNHNRRRYYTARTHHVEQTNISTVDLRFEAMDPLDRRKLQG